MYADRYGVVFRNEKEVDPKLIRNGPRDQPQKQPRSTPTLPKASKEALCDVYFGKWFDTMPKSESQSKSKPLE